MLRWVGIAFALVWGLLVGLEVRDAFGAQLQPTPAAVLAVLKRQPPCWLDRALDPGVKAAQLEVIARAISEASATPERAAYLLSIGWHESKWCVSVHAGVRRGGHGEGLWQLEGAHHGAGARSGLSQAETSSAARMASTQLDRSGKCGRSPAAVFTAYAGRPCSQAIVVAIRGFGGEGWPTLDSRVKTYRWALYALGKASK